MSFTKEHYDLLVWCIHQRFVKKDLKAIPTPMTKLIIVFETRNEFTNLASIFIQNNISVASYRGLHDGWRTLQNTYDYRGTATWGIYPFLNKTSSTIHGASDLKKVLGGREVYKKSDGGIRGLLYVKAPLFILAMKQAFALEEKVYS